VKRYTYDELRREKRAVGRLAVWSAAEALPALAYGYATAQAVDRGFLAHRPGVGLAWLGLLVVTGLLGALGSRGAYRCLGDVVEPFRDRLVTRVVTGAVHEATAVGGRPDHGAVARLTHQVDLVRDTLAGLLTVVRGFLFSGTAALIGLVYLDPGVAGLVAVPLVIGLVMFGCLLPSMARRQRTYIGADEQLAATTGTMLRGHRDVAASGARDWAVERTGNAVDAEAHAERSLARMGALRSTCLAVGGWAPLIVVLVAAPMLVRHGLGAGAILGALVYVRQGLQPALFTLVHGLAGGGLRYGITLRRILTASAVDERVPARITRDATLHLRQVSFRYGPAAEPVLDRFDLDVPDGDHLAIVGASGIGKSTLAGLMAGTLAPQEGEIVRGDRVLLPQEAYVFTGTTHENLTYLAPATSDGQLADAVRALGAEALIRRLGGDLEPATLSAGERQLIA
jgi:ATP-binding cassette subfamily C protein